MLHFLGANLGFVLALVLLLLIFTGLIVLRGNKRLAELIKKDAILDSAIEHPVGTKYAAINPIRFVDLFVEPGAVAEVDSHGPGSIALKFRLGDNFSKILWLDNDVFVKNFYKSMIGS